MNKEHCEFCKNIQSKINTSKEENDDFIKVEKLKNILDLSIDNLKNGDDVIELWISSKWGTFLLDNKFSIGHFNIIPDLTFTYKLTDYCEQQIEESVNIDIKSRLDILNKKLIDIKELINQNVKDDWSLVETTVIWEIERVINGDEE